MVGCILHGTRLYFLFLLLNDGPIHKMKQKDWRQQEGLFFSAAGRLRPHHHQTEERDFSTSFLEPPSKNVIRRHQQGVTTLEFLPPCRRVLLCNTAHIIDTLPAKRYECKYP